MDDLISRQWLMECVNEGWIKFDTEKDENIFIHLVRDIAPSAQPEPIKVSVDREMTEEELKELKKKIADSPVVLMPSAQPGRKKGKWIIDHLCSTGGGTYQVLRCNICEHSEPWQMGRNYCPNCGADMRGEQDE